jgi:hypothetical protein
VTVAIVLRGLDQLSNLALGQVLSTAKLVDPSGWKLLRLDEITSAKILDEKSAAPRSGYRKGDPAILRIVCEV